jgi:chaperone required for assembly of F1-ATPase
MSFFRDLVRLSEKDRLVFRSRDEKELQESDFKDMNAISSDEMVAVLLDQDQRSSVLFSRRRKLRWPSRR